MGTVLEGCTIEKQRSIVRFFLRAKGLDAKDIHKGTFNVYGGVRSVKRFTAGSRNVANVSLMTKRLNRRCGSGRDNSRKTSMLRVSAH
jgi:hypothetical protein